MADTKLKLCPFCGNQKNSYLEVEAKDHGIENRPYGYRFTGKVTCLICGASAVSRGFEETAEVAELSAINAWNRRTENG